MKGYIKFLFTTIIALIFSCKSSQVNNSIIKKSKPNDINIINAQSDSDLVYAAVIIHEMEELGKSFAVVDASMGKCSDDIMSMVLNLT